jgi:hypothetical protein
MSSESSYIAIVFSATSNRLVTYQGTREELHDLGVFNLREWRQIAEWMESMPMTFLSTPDWVIVRQLLLNDNVPAQVYELPNVFQIWAGAQKLGEGVIYTDGSGAIRWFPGEATERPYISTHELIMRTVAYWKQVGKEVRFGWRDV